jgi:hypothetical protein
VCRQLERPGEPAGDNLLVEPVSQPADRGHPTGFYLVWNILK